MARKCRLKQAHSQNLGTSLALGDAFVSELAQNAVLARTYLAYGWKYKHRLLRNRATDALQMLVRETELPRFVWVTEFGTVSSFAEPNRYDRRISAHCVVDATAKNMGEDSRLIFHAPGFAVSRSHDRDNPDGPYREDSNIVTDDTTQSSAAISTSQDTDPPVGPLGTTWLPCSDSDRSQGARSRPAKLLKSRPCATLVLPRQTEARSCGRVHIENFNDFNSETGAGEGIRTLDPNLGKVVLYPSATHAHTVFGRLRRRSEGYMDQSGRDCNREKPARPV
jgi:hypothetical protein